MSYYLYKTPSGLPELLNYALPVLDGFEFIRELENSVETQGMVFDENNHLIPRSKSHHELRAKEYPPLGDQMDMLWHAMNEGTMSKIEPFYSKLKSVKDRYPKPSN